MIEEKEDMDPKFWGMSKEKVWVPIWLAFYVVGLWSLSLVTLNDDKDRGTFGDMFGAINALFSGLAFAGIIYTILLQSKELRLQRDDLALTRAEIKGQKEELENQNKTLSQQRFETTFFNMLSHHNDLIKSFHGRDSSGVEVNGKDFFKAVYRNFIHNMKHNQTSDELAKILITIDGVFLRFSELGTYFRSLEALLYFIDRSHVSNAREYAEIVNAHLNHYEAVILFFFCLSDRGKNLKKLIETYGLLRNFLSIREVEQYTLLCRANYKSGAYISPLNE